METKPRIVKVSKRDAWLVGFDREAFRKDIRALGDELAAKQANSKAEVDHMMKLITWSRTCTLIGLMTLGMGVNLISIVFLCVGLTTRWTIELHHTAHGGFDDVDESGVHNRFKFGLGIRRFSDWLDWMLTEAWNVEHNQLHHYRLNEPGGDPDLVEKNLQMLREMKLPRLIKYMVIAFFASTWKFFYYAPNTFKELKSAQHNRRLAETSGEATESDKEFKENQFTLMSIFDKTPEWITKTELLLVVLGPYFVFNYIVLPLPFLILCDRATFICAFWNLFFADILSNIHSFIIVVTNHAGPDMYVYEKRCPPLSGEFYLRQVLSSADFATGSDLIDFLQGFLNYQVEHHCFPSLSPLCYQIAHPRLKEICAKHRVPFVQESVFIRLYKTIGIMIGDFSSLPFPREWSDDPNCVCVVGEE